MRLLPGALILLLTLPSAIATPEGTETNAAFQATPVADTVTLVVPEKMGLVLHIGLDKGAVADLEIDGPGFCTGSLGAMGAYATRVRQAEIDVDCGLVAPGNYEVTLSSVGAVRGSMSAKGAFFLERPALVDDPR